MVDDKKIEVANLKRLYQFIIKTIGIIIRYGYSNVGGVENIGTLEAPIVDIQFHLNFVSALFKTKANLLNRSVVNLFTLNYDTLLEDALALEKYLVVDGFSGGAVAFWNPIQEFKDKSIVRSCSLFKLHGSVDWYKSDDPSIVRTRYGTKYLADLSNILIYPQATKYVETQKDPFAYMFNNFRKALASTNDNSLVVCGYSFGDDHVNSEIEYALSTPDNKTVLIAFFLEKPNPGTSIVINEVLDKWLSNPVFGSRVFVATDKAIYNGTLIPTKDSNPSDLSWWTFSGLTNFLNTGETR